MKHILYRLRGMWFGLWMTPGYLLGYVVRLSKIGYETGAHRAESRLDALLDEAVERGDA